MADKLTLTNSIYLNCVSFTASSPAGIYTIVPADNTYDRRIYGISATNTSANVHLSCTLWLSDGTKNYQMGVLDLPANAGSSISVGALDIFTNAVFAGILTYSMADTMGVYYFNLPKTWSLKFTYTNTITAGNTLAFTTFGEKYDGITTIHTSRTFQQTATFSNATGTSTINLVSSAAYDRRICGISATSTDATARTMSIRLNNGTTSYLIYTVSVLANSGNSTTIAAQDLFYESFIAGLFVRVADSEGVSYYFNLPAGWSINASLSVATAGVITMKIIGETYE
jgi:hypothetical protein